MLSTLHWVVGELELDALQERPSMRRVRRLFESALTDHGSDYPGQIVYS